MAHRRASDAAGSGRGADAQTLPDAGAITRRQRDEFAELARPHMGVMLRTAAALVGVADAEDAAQEALLRGMLAFAELRDWAALRAWLLRTTANVCADWQRGRFGSDRRRTQPLEGDPAALDATLPVDDSLGGVTHAARLDLRAAINGLEATLRLAVVLRYYAGLDATEIGAIMALPPSTVRSHLRRARLLLRRALEPPGDDSITARERGSPRR
ncbi:MAG TPA: RNA polymerase sigma factor [Ktedonobacterales bacterium]